MTPHMIQIFGKNYYKIILGVFGLALTICAATRVVLKFRFIELETGFYSQTGALVHLFNFTLLAAVLILFISNRLKRVTNDYPVHHNSRVAGLLCAVTGLSIVAYTLFDEPYPILEQNTSETLLQLRDTLCVVLGILAGLSLLCLGISVVLGKLSEMLMAPVLISSIWQVFLLITRFNSFTVLTTISDNLLAVLFMIFATLFLIGQARTMFGLTRKDGRNYTIPSGLCASLTGLALVIPNYAYMAVNRTSMPAIMLGTWESVYTLALSVYAAVFVIGMIRSIKQV